MKDIITQKRVDFTHLHCLNEDPEGFLELIIVRVLNMESLSNGHHEVTPNGDHDMASNGQHEVTSNGYVLSQRVHSDPDPIRVICVGAGASGLCLAYKMKLLMSHYELVCYEKFVFRS